MNTPAPTFDDMACRTCGAEMRGSPRYAFCPDCGGAYLAGKGWIEGNRYYGITGLWQAEQAYKRRLSKPGGGNKTRRRRKPVKKGPPASLTPFE